VALVYDKRGAGKSGGEYEGEQSVSEKNIALLADDAISALKKPSISGLWLFSDNDGSVPVGLSIERLQALRMGGHRYDYDRFSGQGHNNIDGTFATAVDWIKRLSIEGGVQ
jgi:hypothetical protein